MDSKRNDKNNEKEILDYELVKKDLKEKMKDYTVVAKDMLEASIIGEVLMEDNPDILYCRFDTCVSRKGKFIKVIPVLKDNDKKEIRYMPDNFGKSYINYLEERDLIELDEESGTIFIKLPKEDND